MVPAAVGAQLRRRAVRGGQLQRHRRQRRGQKYGGLNVDVRDSTAPNPAPKALEIATPGCSCKRGYTGYTDPEVCVNTGVKPSARALQRVFCRDGWALVSVVEASADGISSACNHGGAAYGSASASEAALAGGTEFMLTQERTNELRGAHQRSIFRIEKDTKRRANYRFTYFKSDGKFWAPDWLGDRAFNTCSKNEDGPWHNASPLGVQGGFTTSRMGRRELCGDDIVWCYYTSNPNSPYPKGST